MMEIVVRIVTWLLNRICFFWRRRCRTR